MLVPVRSGFRLEGRTHGGDLQSQSFDHFLEDVIVEKAQPVRHDLYRDVAITEMECRPRDRHGIVARGLEERLLGGDDQDLAAVPR
jgi:hypothetical protein